MLRVISEAVEKLTGIDISHYVLVKNTALPAIVNAIGEVEFNVPIEKLHELREVEERGQK